MTLTTRTAETLQNIRGRNNKDVVLKEAGPHFTMAFALFHRGECGRRKSIDLTFSGQIDWWIGHRFVWGSQPT